MENNAKHPLVIPVILLIIAYEWLIASVDKLLTKNYLGNMHKQMVQSVPDIQFHPYASLFKNVGIPQSHVFGILVLLGELVVGLTFLIMAIQLIRGKMSSALAKCGFVASIIAAFMNLNYALLGGDTLFIDPANAFQESISVDWILFLFEVTFAFFFYSSSRRSVAVQNLKRI
jgi:thiosulfate dehydrogenase [quinone] large subunit